MVLPVLFGRSCSLMILRCVLILSVIRWCRLVLICIGLRGCVLLVSRVRCRGRSCVGRRVVRVGRRCRMRILRITLVNGRRIRGRRIRVLWSGWCRRRIVRWVGLVCSCLRMCRCGPICRWVPMSCLFSGRLCFTWCTRMWCVM